MKWRHMLADAIHSAAVLFSPDCLHIPRAKLKNLEAHEWPLDQVLPLHAAGMYRYATESLSAAVAGHGNSSTDRRCVLSALSAFFVAGLRPGM